MRKQKNETCPLCLNHCSADNLRCGKGHAHFKNGNKITETGNHHSHREYFKGFGGSTKEKRNHSIYDICNPNFKEVLSWNKIH